jgi:predicted lipoprotein with Yx(FWY)xxD motif
MKDIRPATSRPRPSSSRRKRRFGAGVYVLAAGTAGIGLSVTALAGAASAANRAPAATKAGKGEVVVTMKSVKKYGNVLFDQQGLALYYDTQDKPPHFGCTGGCLTFWPALVLPKGQKAAVAGKGVTGLGAVMNPKLKPAGTMQVTWKGKPLYTYAADSKGTVNGQGIQGIWFVVHLPASLTAAAKSSAASSGSSSGGW